MRLPFLLTALTLAAPAVAQPAALSAGSPLPEAELSLLSADGRQLALGQTIGPNGLVVVFWSNVCPWAERSAERLAALSREYVPAGVAFVAVNPMDAERLPEEGMEGMQRAATAAGFAFPYVADSGGALAGAFGVRSVPTVFYFDAAGRLVYEGAIDDSPADIDAVDVPYLRQAIDQHLAGIPVEVQRTAALGCSVRSAR